MGGRKEEGEGYWRGLKESELSLLVDRDSLYAHLRFNTSEAVHTWVKEEHETPSSLAREGHPVSSQWCPRGLMVHH